MLTPRFAAPQHSGMHPVQRVRPDSRMRLIARLSPGSGTQRMTYLSNGSSALQT
jgi:hypothetical protein